MELKKYQTETLSVLRRFFEDARSAGPKNAYETITQQPEQAERLRGYADIYTPLEALPNVPYVCLRLPTGGGKTILGAYAVAVARDAWIEKDYPVVLWLAPSNTIRLQTVDALKDTHHPYRKVLDKAFDGRVRVFNIADFTQIRPQDLREYCCIVVGTIQSFRVGNTEGRKVYAHHEDMEPHFSAISKMSPDLEKLDNDGVKFSFANLLHIHRPLMIVDEAHNAVSELTRETQGRINPCAIIEFTATPRGNGNRLINNILHSVTALELKHEQMIKLPVMLSEHDVWQNAVNGAIITRAALAESARDDDDYIRPIVLFQAQPKNREVTVEMLRKHLIDAEQIPEEKIAVATGNQRQLNGIDLFDPQCPIEYVITVEALKEGWDCSFAYVFCSVSRIHSAAAVEQLLGRVLRMPFAKRRKDEDLNRAYAHLSEPSFGQAAQALTDKLIAMGFEEYEARDSIEKTQLDLGGRTEPAPPTSEQPPVFKRTVTATPEILSILQEQSKIDTVTYNETGGGKVEIAVTGDVNSYLERAICDAAHESERPEITEAIGQHRKQMEHQSSPAARGESFRIPRLMAVTQEEIQFADSDVFMEFHEWSLLDYTAKMNEDEFAIRETAKAFEIDIDGKQVRYEFVGEEQQSALNVEVDEWKPEALALWLDRETRQTDIPQSALIKWIRDAIDHLLVIRKIPLSVLMRCKFILARKIREKIASIRKKERDNAYQQCLFSPEAKVEISFDTAFSFTDDMYQDAPRYRGTWKPSKHFLGANHVPAFDGAVNGEETQCAKAIDGLDKVKFWTRNVARHPQSFWLPTASDRFYPDFVAQLDDERLFVVEYKGAHIADSADTNEKRTIGELWQQKSDGKGLFTVVEKRVNGRNMFQQLTAKISGD